MNNRFDVECIGHDIRSTQFARGVLRYLDSQ